jgi:hypothetical protein
MRITNTAKVGIGTTSPSESSKLTISSVGEFGIDLTNTGTGGVSWQLGATNNAFGAGGGKFVLTYGNNSAASVFTAVQSTGNILIGTTTDSGYKLTVNGSTYSNTIDLSTQGVNVSNFGFLSQTLSGQMTLLGHNVRASASVNNEAVVVNAAWISSVIKQYYSDGITFHTSNTEFAAGANYPFGDTEKMRITPGGNVGIGTNSPRTNEGTPLTLQSSDGYVGITLNGTGSYENIWQLYASGNAGSLKFLGMYDRTAGRYLLVTTNNGNVLIGTTTDNGDKLQVNGQTTIFGNIYLRGGTRSIVGDGGDLLIDTENVAGRDILLQTQSGQNVGVGTTTPDTRLQVAGTLSSWVEAGNAGAIQSGTFEQRTLSFNLGPSDSVDISTIGLSSDAQWKAIVSGEYANNNEGGGLVSGPLEIELDSTSPTIPVGSTSIVLSRNPSTGKLRATNTNGTFRVTLVGSIKIWNFPQSIMPSTSKVLLKNVGIGTTSPASPLQVSAASVLSQGVLSVVNTYASGGVYYPAARFINQRGDHSFGILSEFYTGATSGTDRPSILFNTGVSSNSWQVGMVTSGWGGNDSFGIGYRASNDPASFSTWPTSRFLITTGGNVLIGTTTDAGYKLDVVGDTRITSGSLGVGVAPNATDGRIDASNDIVAYQTSDQRLKENVTPIENALEKVKSLTGVEFDWIEEHKHIHGYEGHDTGIIAQQVQAVMPTAVRTNDSGYLSVRYEKMIALLIEGMKEQQNQIDELKAKLDDLTC